MSTDRPHPGVSRRTLVHGAAWSVPVVSFATATPAMAASPGPCLPEGTLFQTRAQGRLLGGTILGADLDIVAALQGAEAEVAPGEGAEEQNNPLSATVLNALTVNLNGVASALSSVLAFTTGNQPVGLLNQHARAEDVNGVVRGASGAVANNGALELAPGGGWPELASLDLYQVLQRIGGPSVASLLTMVTDLDLSIGAVAGRSAFTSLCEPPADLDRDYLLAFLKLVLDSPTVGALATALDTALTGLTISTDDVWNLLAGIPALGPLLAAVGRSALQVSVTTDTTALLGSTVPAGSGQALQIDFPDGEIVLDLAAVLGGAYTGTTSAWLNGLAPNTRLFIDAPLPTGAVTTILDNWVDALVEALKPLVTITVEAGTLLGTGLRITGTLGQFLDGTATASFSVIGAPVGLGSGLLVGLLGDIGQLVLDTLDTLLRPAGTLNTMFTGLNSLLAVVFTILEQVVVLTVNAQNAAGGSQPADFAAIPAGQYDVAALHLGAVGLLDVLDLFLGRGSAGPSTAQP